VVAAVLGEVELNTAPRSLPFCHLIHNDRKTHSSDKSYNVSVRNAEWYGKKSPKALFAALALFFNSHALEAQPRIEEDIIEAQKFAAQMQAEAKAMLHDRTIQGFPNIEMGLRLAACAALQMLTDPTMSSTELQQFKSFWTDFKGAVQQAQSDLELSDTTKKRLQEELAECERSAIS
jgi:hypothetical protein